MIAAGNGVAWPTWSTGRSRDSTFRRVDAFAYVVERRTGYPAGRQHLSRGKYP